jgi:hypothetical protein
MYFSCKWPTYYIDAEHTSKEQVNPRLPGVDCFYCHDRASAYIDSLLVTRSMSASAAIHCIGLSPTCTPSADAHAEPTRGHVTTRWMRAVSATSLAFNNKNNRAIYVCTCVLPVNTCTHVYTCVRVHLCITREALRHTVNATKSHIYRGSDIRRGYMPIYTHT